MTPRYLFTGCLFLAGSTLAFAEPPADAVFQKTVEPLFAKHCFSCHGGEKQRAGLDLRTPQLTLKGGKEGPVILPGKASESVLVELLAADGKPHMPPKGQLTEEEITAVRQWINGLKPDPNVAVRDRSHWAYKPLTKLAPTAVKNAGWAKTPIDQFILAKLEAANLTPNAPATKIQLLRRAYYDLTGLPPTVAAIDAALADNAPNWYEKVVDQLLQSPQYGEKWGRHWLDIVHYSETNGYERDGDKANVWKYRDYVIRAFNNDKPYDRFILEQLAGDELPDADYDSLVATGYYRLGLWDDEPVDRVAAYYDGLDEVVSTTGQVFLGLTIGCARCHDHKLDPVLQKDYFSFLAFFHNVKHGNTQTDVPMPDERRRYEADLAKHKGQLRALDISIGEYEARIFDALSNPEKEDARDEKTRENLFKQRRTKALPPDQLKEYVALRADLDRLKKSAMIQLPSALTVSENGKSAPVTNVHLRGNPHAKGDEVPLGVPGILPAAASAKFAPQATSNSSGRRLALARWIASKDNGTTARVMANRIWQFHFGRGIVESSNDFGKAGTPPTHPELLDWLAGEFVARGWRIKEMHKLIMLSNAYQMAAQANPEALAKDPQNRLFWRFDMRRLTAEEVRDSILEANGTLNRKMFGPPIYPPLPAEVLATASNPSAAWGKSSPEDAARRSVYIKVKRSLRVPLLANFDAPDTDSSCAVRFTTTVPTQALGLLNSAFSNEQAARFAARLQKEAPGGLADQVKHAIRLTTNRLPEADEVARDVKFIEELRGKEKLTPEKALAHYCLLLINSNEFVYLD